MFISLFLLFILFDFAESLSLKCTRPFSIVSLYFLVLLLSSQPKPSFELAKVLDSSGSVTKVP